MSQYMCKNALENWRLWRQDLTDVYYASLMTLTLCAVLPTPPTSRPQCRRSPTVPLLPSAGSAQPLPYRAIAVLQPGVIHTTMWYKIVAPCFNQVFPCSHHRCYNETTVSECPILCGFLVSRTTQDFRTLMASLPISYHTARHFFPDAQWGRYRHSYYICDLTCQ